MTGQAQRERVAVQEQQREAPGELYYDTVLAITEAYRNRSSNGRVYTDGDKIPWQTNRQGEIGYYIHERVEDTAMTDWRIFIHRIRNHSGAHIHQGGVVLYIISGRGYTVVNGVRHDWQMGDLVLLPVVPGGVEHQHFNADPNEPSDFLAFIYLPFQYATGAIFEQVKDAPEWEK
jgi:hypothetical protein